MKGVVLLAVIHIFIIYQSEKRKVRPQTEIPEPPQVIVKAKQQPVKPAVRQYKPDFARFMFTGSVAPSWSGYRNPAY